MSRKLRALLDDLESREPAKRYAASKALREWSDVAPERLYPELGRFTPMLMHNNSFLRWDATRIVANLAAVADDATAKRLLEQLVVLISGPQMVGASTAIASLANVALAKPRFADWIAREILEVRTAEFQTPECRGVAIGHAIESLCRFFHLLADQAPVLKFAAEQLANPRNATRNKAARFLKKHKAAKAAAR